MAFVHTYRRVVRISCISNVIKCSESGISEMVMENAFVKNVDF